MQGQRDGKAVEVAAAIGKETALRYVSDKFLDECIKYLNGESVVKENPRPEDE